MTHEQIALVINNHFKFDAATGKLVSQREQFCFCTYTYWHHLENLSYQAHAKLWVLKKFLWGHFFDQMTETIVACGALRVKVTWLQGIYIRTMFHVYVFALHSYGLALHWQLVMYSEACGYANGQLFPF